MQELIAKIAADNGIDTALAEKSIGMILGFLKKEADPNAVSQMLAAMPGAEALIPAEGAGGGMMGSLMGMMPGGGGVMGLGAQLMGAGLGMGQIPNVSKALFEAAKEKAGEDVMGQIVGSVPGLSQFV